ncbi:HSCB C-terminal oligomerization domain containing protein [Pyrenophora tritici-repentis]|uniref:HSCB C-terminal oligomerization domain containing protein n=2 Tax=Pyrenophora tritici-repentis TaxID=45151 RepID=A0A922NJH1_9PLEO|nr:co-chaperone protein HscB, mitochondrial precursor [Pyrenophora tritici-repentis Pt-1C-BFP]EDU50610.1 co-chaperone protein HscB, mitochondrial precursor [Pyrenophora tritici-repentis Pt-1C-BFP]KAI1515394.1 HSCB C-terminal oligomerization domain containing protein [Pyrenophora tritici-repentis]KAI1664285.1 HSCB C-terminal oligomerization domain containing protein [Pyrenophora tritici-repentis]KAI1678376.1 HSCB C-terminal oligomerization domain containing protein [Pyrenophora tritici-repentis]
MRSLRPSAARRFGASLTSKSPTTIPFRTRRIPPPCLLCAHRIPPQSISRRFQSTSTSSNTIEKPFESQNAKQQQQPQNYYSFFPETLPAGPPPNGPFDIDVKALKKEFLKLQSTAHPDLHQQADKKRAEAHSAQINEAYKTLENPLLRAQYLLSMRGEELEDETAKVDDMQLLLEVMETREMLEEAEWDGNLKEIWDKNENRIKKNVKAIDRAFKRDDLEAAKKAAVSLRYWVNIRDTILEKD